MDASKIETVGGCKWDDEIVPQLVEYIRIPNKTPMFDADWVKNGYMEDAVKLMEAWAGAQPIPGITLEVVRVEGRTPRIFIDIPASGAETGAACVLLYGHLALQPESTGRATPLRPSKPVLGGERLDGRRRP